MELVREDGGVIQLEEGQRLELGRGSKFVEMDGSVSRLQVVAELLRPASRKGKEVVGESLSLKLLLQVFGRNPICVAARGGQEMELPKIKFVGNGEVYLLVPGDEFSLSIKRPLFYKVRQCFGASFGTKEEPLGLGQDRKPANNMCSSPMVMEVQSRSSEDQPLSEEQGIAEAVARRQRRRLEKEHVDQRLQIKDNQRPQNDRLENSEANDVQNARREGDSTMPRQTSTTAPPFDPVTEFGFLVRGMEFQQYKKQNEAGSRPVWNWKIKKKRGSEEDDQFIDTNFGQNSRASDKQSHRVEQEDLEWGGDSKEEQERIGKVLNLEKKDKVLTRGSRSRPTDLTVKSGQHRPQQDLTASKKIVDSDEEMSNFIVEDDDLTEEDDEEEEDEWTDDSETGSHQGEKKRTNGTTKKPMCKYGKNCYRKSKEHLSEFSH